MDAIKAAIAKKRKQAEEEQQRVGGRKYYRKADLQASSDDERDAVDNVDETPARKPDKKTSKASEKPQSSNTDHTSSTASTAVQETEEGEPPLPVTTVQRALRAMNEPITLFAETPWARYRRYKQLELARPQHQEATAAQDDFRRALATLDTDDDNVNDGAVRQKQMSAAERAALAYAEQLERERLSVYETEGDLTTAQKAHTVECILKRLLREWDEKLSQRSEAERKTVQGKVATATHMQCNQHLEPLFKGLQDNTVEENVVRMMFDICVSLDRQEYVKAHDAYILLAIGNAAWPMGVTMVGIHERAGRSKIYDTKTAHILNDETQRKYITAIKRVMSFAQDARPTKPSQMVRQ